LSKVQSALEESWAVELGRFGFRDGSATRQLNDAIAFFSRAFELAVLYKQHSVLRFALVTAQRWTFPDDGWRTFQGLLFRAANADPGTLPVAIVLLTNHVAAGRQINQTGAREVIEALVERHSPLGHGSEVAWALWVAIQFSVGLSAEAAASVSAMDDDIVALLAMDADSRGLFPPNALDRTRWQQTLNTPEVLHEEHWLLAYEANRKTWLQCSAVAQHPFFSILEANAIAFYDPSQRLTAFVGAAAAVPGGGLGRGYG
jgi:hypothetical protein